MKPMIAHALLILSATVFATSAQAFSFATEGFIGNVVAKCPEGETMCQNVTYVGISRKTGETITLKGGVFNAGQNFGGWKFKNKDYTYTIMPNGNDGSLVVTQKDKEILDQQFIWSE